VVAAALFPYLKREMYNSTPIAKYKIGPIPIISLCAVIFLAFVVFVDVQAFRAPELGLNGSPGLIFIGGTYVIAATVYLTSKIYRKRKDNLDLSLVYQELPAE
jgi:basic amino acid/polyamine antiporter, APA family